MNVDRFSAVRSVAAELNEPDSGVLVSGSGDRGREPTAWYRKFGEQRMGVSFDRIGGALLPGWTEHPLYDATGLEGGGREPMGDSAYYAHRIERSLEDQDGAYITLHRDFLAGAAQRLREGGGREPSPADGMGNGRAAGHTTAEFSNLSNQAHGFGVTVPLKEQQR